MNAQVNRTPLRRLLLVLLPSVICAAGAFAQSSFVFQNYAPNAGIDAPVFDEVGNRLFGTHYVAVLYGGPTVDSLAPARLVNPRFQMEPVPFTDIEDGQAGYFDMPGYVQITTVPCLGLAWLQVRAWDLRLGATYD